MSHSPSAGEDLEEEGHGEETTPMVVNSAYLNLQFALASVCYIVLYN